MVKNIKGYVKIKLASTNINDLNRFIDNILEKVEKAGVDYKGPIPLPTKRLTFSTRKTPCGRGAETFERWELRIHKRLLFIKMDDRVIRTIAKSPIPDSVKIEMKLL